MSNTSKAEGQSSPGARRCEVDRQDMVTFPSSSDEEDLRTDPAYEDTSIQSDSNSKSESEAESIMGADPTVLYAVIHSEVLTKKRKERREIADLIPERPEKIPRTTEWRNRKGKTKKARAKLMQPSMASLFKVIPKSGPTKSINNQHLVHEIIDLDSGTEIIKPVPVSPEHSRPVREVPVTENRGRWISEAWPTGVKGEVSILNHWEVKVPNYKSKYHSRSRSTLAAVERAYIE